MKEERLYLVGLMDKDFNVIKSAETYVKYKALEWLAELTKETTLENGYISFMTEDGNLYSMETKRCFQFLKIH